MMSYTYTYISFISLRTALIPYVLYLPVIQNRRHHQSDSKGLSTRPRTDDYCRLL